MASPTHAVRRFLVSYLVGLMMFLLAATMAVAQVSTGTILGTVKDSSGAVVPNANVTARNTDTGQSRAVPSESDGSFRLSALPIGNYEVRVEHEGFQSAVRSGLELVVGQEAVVNVALQIGSTDQTVSVTAEAPLINTTSGSLGAIVDEQKIQDLPLNGRNFTDLTMLQPGISQQTNKTGGGGMVGEWFSSSGLPVRSNNILLDGATLVNTYGTSAASVDGTTLGLEGIQEWRVITNAVSAEYGMTMGSQMLLASKGGTNDFHGSAFEFLRNNVLDAANFFYLPVAANGFARIPTYKRNNFGGAFGGPIKKDKTFFYAVYEGLRERLGQTIVNTVLPAADLVNTNNPGCGGCTVAAIIQPFLALYPTPNYPSTTTGAAANRYTFPFTQPTAENFGQIRVDHNLSSADQLFARYTLDDTQQVQTGSYPRFVLDASSRSQFLTLSETHIFNPALLNTARFSFSRTNDPQSEPPSGLIGPQFTMVAGYEIGSIGITGTTAFTSIGNAPQLVKRNVFTWSDDVFYTKGRNAFKFGVLINRYQDQSLRFSGAKGGITFPNISSFLQANYSSYTTALTPGSILGRIYHYSTIGSYAQDDLHILKNLTLNLGLRYEFTTTYQEALGHGASFHNIATDAGPMVGPPFMNPSLHNFGPRIGFAWDVMGDGKTAVRGGYGLLYDIATMGFALFQNNLMPPWGSSSTVSTAGTLTALPLVFPASAQGKTINGILWNLKQPQAYQYNLAVDRQLPKDWAITVAYAGSRGLHLIQTTDGNPIPPSQFVNGLPVWDPFICGGVLSPANTGGCTANASYARINTNWGADQWTGSGGDSWYNGLQVLVSKHLSKGLSAQSSLTYSKVFDDLQGQAGGESDATPIYPAWPQNIKFFRAPATFDSAMNLHLNAIYEFPNFHNKQGFLGGLLSGWGTTGILTVQSGYPFTPVITVNRSASGAAGGAVAVDSPNIAPGRTINNILHGTSTGCGAIKAGTPLGTPSLWFDPCGFTLQPVGTLGTATRDSLRGPPLRNLDFSLIKDTPLRFREGASLEFRAEFFNVLNHPSFAAPLTSAGALVFAGTLADSTENPAGTAGQSTLTTNTARQVQFALKLLF